MEAFFLQSSKMTRPPTPEEADQQFAAHGMKVVGPPLNVAERTVERRPRARCRLERVPNVVVEVTYILTSG
jgi:N-acetylmuramoyl-L-alanine amidase